MAGLLERIPLEQIRAEAKALDPAKVALTLAMLPFYLAGFIAFHVLRFGWLVVSLCWSAGVVGFRQASGATRDSDGQWFGGRKIRDP